MSNNETRVSNERLEEMIGGLTIWLQSGRSGGPDLDRDTLMALTELQALRSTPVEADHIADAGKMVEAQPLPNPSPSDGEVREKEVEQTAGKLFNRLGLERFGMRFEDVKTVAREILQSKRGQP